MPPYYKEKESVKRVYLKIGCMCREGVRVFSINRTVCVERRYYYCLPAPAFGSWGYPPWVFTTHLSQAVVYSVADTTSAYTASAAGTTEAVTTITKLLSEIDSSAGTASDRQLKQLAVSA